MREGITEAHDLSEEDQILLMKETTYISKKLQEAFSPKKINIGALGNMVPQLHMHVICRYEDDRGWPGALWGKVGPLNHKKMKEIHEIVKSW